MRIARSLPLLALVALAACAEPFTTRVTRFNLLATSAPQGSFVVQPRDPSRSGSIEFRTYAEQVTQRLAQSGYQPARSPSEASLVVTLDYGVDQGREKIETRPGIGGGFGYGGYGGGYGGFGGGFGGFGGGYGGFGGRGFGRFGYGGLYDPFWGWGGWDYPEVYSYTQYTGYLDIEMRRTSSNESVFEGHAIAHSATNNLTKLVPGLVQGMFTAFPGHSGETIRVSLDSKGRATVSMPRHSDNGRGYGNDYGNRPPV